MDNNQQSKYLYEQYEEALSEKLKARKSQYVLEDLNKKAKQPVELKPVTSQYLLRSLQNQDEQNQNFSRDAPARPFLIGAPVSAKQIRTQIESLDNAIVVPQIIDGRVYFLTHGDSDTHTAVESASATSQTGHIDLSKVKFSYAQLVQLLGPSTCQRLEREFAKQNRLSELELSQLRTARNSVSRTDSARSPAVFTANSLEPNLLSVRTANSLEPNLLSTRTANSLEPNLLSVHSARSPGAATLIFARSPGIHTAQEREPNLLSIQTANSLEPNLLSCRTARSRGMFSARSPSVYTANSIEPNLLSTRTANSLEPNLLSVRTANSLEPNLLSVHSARSPGPATLIFARSPGIHTAQEREPNLLSTRTANSATSVTGSESDDVATCLEIADLPTTDVLTAMSIRSRGSRSSQDVATALPILTLLRSSQDVGTARGIDSIRSSHDVETAREAPSQTFTI